MTSISLELIRRIKEVAFLEGDFTTRSGKKTNYYIDKYLFETEPDILEALAQELANRFPSPSTYDRIAAPALGAVPLASVLATKVNKPFVIVRKETKGYGTENRIEGHYNKNDRMIMVEDVLTTGGAAISAGEALEANGVTLLKVFGIINREEGAIENIKKKGWQVEGLITTTDLKQC